MSISQATLTDGAAVRAIGGRIVRSGPWEYRYFYREDGPQTFRFTLFPNNNIPVRLLVIGPGSAGGGGSNGSGQVGGNGGQGGGAGEALFYNNLTTGQFGTTVTWTASGGKGGEFFGTGPTSTVFTSTLSSFICGVGFGGEEGGLGGGAPGNEGSWDGTGGVEGVAASYIGEPFYVYYGATGSGGGGGAATNNGYGGPGGQAATDGSGGGRGANGQNTGSFPQSQVGGAGLQFGSAGGGGGGGAGEGSTTAGAAGGNGADGVVIIAFKYRGN